MSRAQPDKLVRLGTFKRLHRTVDRRTRKERFDGPPPTTAGLILYEEVDVEVWADAEAIARRLGARAVRNKGRVAHALGGAVVAIAKVRRHRV